MDTSSRTWIEAYGAEYGEFLRDLSNGEFEDLKNEIGMAPDEAEWENIQSEDAHLEAAYEDRYSMYDQDLMDLEDFASQYDDDPNVYSGTYSEE